MGRGQWWLTGWKNEGSWSKEEVRSGEFLCASLKSHQFGEGPPVTSGSPSDSDPRIFPGCGHSEGLFWLQWGPRSCQLIQEQRAVFFFSSHGLLFVMPELAIMEVIKFKDTAVNSSLRKAKGGQHH